MSSARIGYLRDIVLYADLRQRLEPLGELVRLGDVPREQLAAALGGLDVVLHHPLVHVDGELLGEALRLRAVLAPGAGYDGIDIAAATERGILVTHQAGCNDEAVAEHAIGLMLSVAKRIAEGDRLIHGGTATDHVVLFNNEIAGRTLGIVGLGAIGRRLARIAHAGFGMTVLASDPYLTAVPEGVPAQLVDLDELLRSAQALSLHLPLTAETRGLIGARELALLPQNAIVVNTARGHILDLDALAAELTSGRLMGAGLDVFDEDALPAGHPLLTHPRSVMTPHAAGATHESLASQAQRQAAAVRSLLEGRVPETARVLNPEAAASFLHRFGAPDLAVPAG